MTAKHFEDNCYLLRDNQLSGSVYFYKPEGGLINGWRYKDGKIVATIRQGTTEGVEMQKDAGTRFYTPCHFETVWIEYNDCDGFIYNDPEYGLGFGSECQKRYKAETVEVCDGIYVDDDGNEHDWFPDTDSGNGGGGVSNGGDNKTEAEPLPEKVKELIEKNQNLDKKDLDSLCSFIDKMSDECEDCGNCGDYALYTGLTSYNFKFNEVLKEAPKNNASAAYRPEKGNLVFYTTGNLNYNSFTHEMFHLFQHKFKGKFIEEERGFMEYERTLFDDIIFFVKILKGNWSDHNKFGLKKNPWVYNGEKTEDIKTTENYKNWLSKITDSGTKIPTELNAKELLTYAQFYGKVNISYNKSKYNYEESVGYRFNAIIELLRIANSKCK